jgi:hypothetical protein
VGQDAAFEEGVELLFDEPGQLGAGAGLGMGDETGDDHHALAGAHGGARLRAQCLLLGIPILIAVTAVCDRVDHLKPVGELLGT